MKSIVTKQVIRWRNAQPSPVKDSLVVEEPLEIRVDGQSLIVVMRTPGHDFDLAAGFLYTEGLITSSDDIGTIAYCEAEDIESPNLQNIINVHLTNGQILEEQEGWQRNFHANASCGLCGKMTIESVKQEIPPITSKIRIDSDILYLLNNRLRSTQSIFEATGGLHAAGLFDDQGELQIIREDVGRHNAVDKVIGQALLVEKLPLDRHILMVSGRASFEIIQKALFARIPVIVAVSAASSLAVELAQEGGSHADWVYARQRHDCLQSSEPDSVNYRRMAITLQSSLEHAKKLNISLFRKLGPSRIRFLDFSQIRLCSMYMVKEDYSKWKRF